MNVNPEFISEARMSIHAAVKLLPDSHKVYVQGSHADLLVPMLANCNIAWVNS